MPDKDFVACLDVTFSMPIHEVMLPYNYTKYEIVLMCKVFNKLLIWK